MRTWEMPKLNLLGSAKQIKWATDIVADIYATANENVKSAYEKQWPHAEKWEEGFGKIISQLEAVLAKTDQAAEIISRREMFSSKRVLFIANKYVREASK